MAEDITAIAATVGKIHGLLEQLTEAVGALHQQLTGPDGAEAHPEPQAGPESHAEPPTSPEEPAAQELASQDAAPGREDLNGAVPTENTEPLSPLLAQWRELWKLRPELAGIEPGDGELERQLSLVLPRLGAADRLAWRQRLFGDDYQGPCLGETALLRALDEQVAGVLGNRLPRLREALAGIGLMASEGAGLGQIDLRAASGGEWLQPLAPGDFGSVWERLLDYLGRFTGATHPDDRWDALIQLDMRLRLVVPAAFTHIPDGQVTGRICPPAEDSEWVRLLAGCLEDICAYGGSYQPPRRAGHAAAGISFRDSQSTHHVAGNLSFRQLVAAESDEAHQVLWPLSAWSEIAQPDPGRPGERVVEVKLARVVYGAPPG
jgi:hypothetical protein